MRSTILIPALAGAMMLVRPACAAATLRFWNLTSVTIVELSLAPAGTHHWSPNQCKNDPDHEVDSDERLTLSDIAPGRYDVKLTDKSGRHCVVSGIDVKDTGHYAFALEDRDLTECKREEADRLR